MPKAKKKSSDIPSPQVAHAKLPSRFLWGAATAAHQVEGDTYNDWTEWEREHAEGLATRATSWPEKTQTQFPEMLTKENYISGSGADHYHLYKKDFQIAASLHHNAHRFSIEWSRIEPREDIFSEDAIEHYRGVIKELKRLDIEPIVTLYHWTLPLWFRDKGGWLHHEAPHRFARFADRMSREFPEVKFWVTINEPTVYASHGYLLGQWPPMRKGLFLYLSALKQLVKAHSLAYKRIHKHQSHTYVGIASHNKDFKGFFAPIKSALWNHWFLKRIRNTQDFIGLNYYFSERKGNYLSDMGWKLVPEGIEHALVDLKKYHKPVIITEVGLADATDEHRSWYIASTVQAMKRAMEQGVDVWGYLHWSLLDNFEWDKGFWPRFGLVAIDYKTKKRKIRPSAEIYKDIIDKWEA